MHKILLFFLLPVLATYAQYLTDERIKAQEYVDQLNDTRNYTIGTELTCDLDFARDWFEYEEEYQYNWGE